MNLLDIEENELYSILQKISLVNIKFFGTENYIAVAVLYSNKNMLDVVIDFKKCKYIIDYGEEVQLKFIKDGYEYILDGKITEVSTEEHATATIYLTKWHKYLNKRRFIRYNTDQQGEIFCSNCVSFPCNIQNLSMGGAMVRCDNHIKSEETVLLRSNFFGNNEMEVSAHIIRTLELSNGGFSYGLEFEDVDAQSEMVLRKTLFVLEKNYLRNLDGLRQVKVNTNHLNSTIAFFNLCMCENMDIKEALGRLGIVDYSVFHDFKVYSDYFAEEKLGLVIIDSDEITKKILAEIITFINSYPSLNIILALPMQNLDDELLSIINEYGIELIFKPFICNELENIIIKHL